MHSDEVFLQEQAALAVRLAMKRRRLVHLGAAFRAVMKRRDSSRMLIKAASRHRVCLLRTALGSTRLETAFRPRFERLFDKLAVLSSAAKQA
ncbi:MAG: hypothetical protein K6E40_12060 [Desulfovibrio sp.]|nr:hypothetical protein [Desulfovibrio sp.]